MTDGVALLITVLILFVVSLLGATAVSLGRVDYALSGNYRSSATSLSLADSGLQATVADLRSDYDADPTRSFFAAWVDLSTNPSTIVSPFPDPDGMRVNGHVLRRAFLTPDPYPGTPWALGGAASLGNGTYARTVWLPPAAAVNGNGATLAFRVRSVGTDASRETPATTIIDGLVRVDLRDVGGYSTAAFFGAGDNGDVIDGGIVRLAGPVVVIGEERAVRRRRRATSEFRLGNFSRIVNGYEGIGATWNLGVLAGKLPPLSPRQYNGDTVTSLNATVYLKDAELALSPRASMGAPDVPGNTYQETLAGVYTDGDIEEFADNIHADEVSGYDLSDDIAFPSLSNPYVDPTTGIGYPTFTAYLNAASFAPLGNEDLEITGATASFSYVDANGRGSITWDAASETLTVDGIVKIDGDLTFGDTSRRGSGTLGAVKYAGTGVLWATDDIRVHRSIYPVGRYLDDGPDADALIDGNLGLIASGEVRVDAGWGSRNIRIFGAVFAEERVDLRSHTNIAGALLTNAVDIRGQLGLNVWYVPRLASAAPPGMPVALSAPALDVGITEWFQRR